MQGGPNSLSAREAAIRFLAEKAQGLGGLAAADELTFARRSVFDARRAIAWLTTLFTDILYLSLIHI